MRSVWAEAAAVKHSLVVIQALFSPIVGGENVQARQKLVGRAWELLRSDSNVNTLGPRPQAKDMPVSLKDALNKASQH